jgi:[ribosomal protein S5]-alanine N-acetyltransferase
MTRAPTASFALLTLSVDDTQAMIKAPARYIEQQGIVLAEGIPKQSFVLQRALAAMQSQPAFADWHAPRVYVLYQHNARFAVGMGGFKAAPHDGAVEMGYGVSPAWRGKSVATQGCALLCDYAFSHGIKEVFATTAPGNIASWRALQTTGFARSGEVLDAKDGALWRWSKFNPSNVNMSPHS